MFNTTLNNMIGQLFNLQELILDYNPIIDLPKELESLVRLKTLSIKGQIYLN
jgi:Leucine-rich repeat (LRR) protein